MLQTTPTFTGSFHSVCQLRAVVCGVLGNARELNRRADIGTLKAVNNYSYQKERHKKEIQNVLLQEAENLTEDK